MIRILILLVVVSFLITGCSGVDVYTFKKERVDQNLKGNEGYVMGERPDVPREKRSTKRTLIGVDIDMSDLGAEGTEEAPEPQPSKEKVQVQKVEPQKIETRKLKPEEVGTEEDWIK